MASKAYSRYKEKYNRKQAAIFFEEHKKDKWFLEKYHPIRAGEIQVASLTNRREILYTRFKEAFESGKLNGIKLEISEKEFSSLKQHHQR